MRTKNNNIAIYALIGLSFILYVMWIDINENNESYPTHLFGVLFIIVSALAIYGDYKDKNLKIYSFSVIGSFLFLWGTLGPYVDIYILGSDKVYAHFDESYFKPAMLYALICYTLMWIGYLSRIRFSTKIRRNLTVMVYKEHTISKVFFYILLVILIVTL